MQSQPLSSHPWTALGLTRGGAGRLEGAAPFVAGAGCGELSFPAGAPARPSSRPGEAGLWAFGGHPNSVSSLLLPLLQVMCSVCYIASPSSMTVRLTTWAAAERKPS